jgi:cell division protein FtsB
LNIFLLYSIFFSNQGILGFRQQYQQARELQTKIRKLKSENQKLFNQIQALKNDPQAQERQVREHLGWTRDDELVVEFPQARKDRPE